MTFYVRYFCFLSFLCLTRLLACLQHKSKVCSNRLTTHVLMFPRKARYQCTTSSLQQSGDYQGNLKWDGEEAEGVEQPPLVPHPCVHRPFNPLARGKKSGKCCKYTKKVLFFLLIIK